MGGSWAIWLQVWVGGGKGGEETAAKNCSASREEEEDEEEGGKEGLIQGEKINSSLPPSLWAAVQAAMSGVSVWHSDDLGRWRGRAALGPAYRPSTGHSSWPRLHSLKVNEGRKHLRMYLSSSLQRFTLLTVEVHHRPLLKVSVPWFYITLSCFTSQIKPWTQILFVLLSIRGHSCVPFVRPPHACECECCPRVIRWRMVDGGQNSAVAPGQPGQVDKKSIYE